MVGRTQRPRTIERYRSSCSPPADQAVAVPWGADHHSLEAADQRARQLIGVWSAPEAISPHRPLVVAPGVRVAQRARGAGGRGGSGRAVAAKHVEIAVPERGERGDVLIPDLVVLRAELGDGGVDVPGRPEHGVQDQAERAELGFHPYRYGWWMVPFLPWQMSRASLWRDSWKVGCSGIWRR